MSALATADIAWTFFALGVLLATARIMAAIAIRLGQPALLGEVLAGVLLGPTVLGRLAPHLTQTGSPIVPEALSTVAVVLFLLVAGMDVDLSAVWRQGQAAIQVGISGLAVPFLVGFGGAWLWPGLCGGQPAHDQLVFSLFLGTALSISALPVIARTLKDLNLYRSDLGAVVISAAVFQDLLGWILFAAVLGLLHSGWQAHVWRAGQTVALTLAFALAMLTVGRWSFQRGLRWLQAHAGGPGAALTAAVSLAFLGAAFAEWVGVHAIFGAFLAGIAIGGSSHLSEKARAGLDQVVSGVFAPLFFCGMGLKVNFLAHLDLQLVVVVLLMATVGKMVPCALSARWSGMPARSAWAVGFCMNSRGAMEIILGLTALKAGLIAERVFVALVVMALLTSMMSGPLVQWVLRAPKPKRLINFRPVERLLLGLKSARRYERSAN